MKKLGTLLGVAAVAVISAPVMAAHLDNLNLAQNAGFEDPIANTDDSFVGRWQPFSLDGDEVAGPDTSQTSTTMPRSGASSLDLVIDNTANSFAGAFQDIKFPTGLGGTDTWFSGWHKLGDGAGGTEIRIEWRDSAANTEVSRTPNLTPTIGPDYEEFVLPAQIPAGANVARIVYAIQSFGGPPTQQVFVDDVNFNIAGIPEPTSLLLLSMGGCALISARRRR